MVVRKAFRPGRRLWGNRALVGRARCLRLARFGHTLLNTPTTRGIQTPIMLELVCIPNIIYT